MAAVTDKFLKYRGDITGVAGLEGTLALTTVHPEDQPTALYRVNLDKGELSAEALPCGGRALISDEVNLYFVGTDGRLYRAPIASGAPEAFGDVFDPAPTALAPLSEGRMAAMAGTSLHILKLADGAIIQTLTLPHKGTTIAADPTGEWIAVGTAKGTLAIFDCEEKPQFLAGSSAKVHSGEISSLLFEPDELRVMSAGADGAIFITHTRGTLEPEDRSGRGGHSGACILVDGLEDRFYTGGRDGNVKVWTRGSGTKRPSTLKDTLNAIVGLAQVTYKDRPHMAVATSDNAIRLFIQDAAGKLEHRALTIKDAYAWARRAFRQKEVARRQEALEALAGFNDAKSIEMLESRAQEDDDHPLRVLAVELLGNTGNRRAVQPLEGLLRGRTEKVRRAALVGLRGLEGEANLRPLELALNARKADIGVEAVKALGELSSSDDQALTRLTKALNDNPREVRFAALEVLEGFYGDDAQGCLVGLTSGQSDLRWQALLRLHQRGLLDQQPVRSAVRRTLEDGDATVRLMAFDVLLLSRPLLAQGVRHLDKSVHRRLHQIETHGEEIDAEAPLPKTKKIKTADLTPEDNAPLLEAMAGQALDTCVRGAVHLAQLQDPRAFGTLLQLTRVDDASARVEACRALEALGDPRGLQRLRLMLRDGTAQVRDAAFTALSRLLASEPLQAAEAGLMAEHEDVRRRGLSVLTRQLKKRLPKDAADPAYGLLERALNDTASAVRGEAFKATINLQIMGGGADTLRYALKSLHADIRREVLTEVMGEIAHPWAWAMLLELFDDPDASIRADASAFAKKKGKGKELERWQRALKSPYKDMRLQAVKAAGAKFTKETGPLLIEALGDVEAEVRQVAISALTLAEANDALVAAMGSEHPDVRIRAAAARAVVGDANALAPLMAQATSEKPKVSDLADIWRADLFVALQGLEDLADPTSVEALVALLGNDDQDIARKAASALAWAADPEDTAPLKAALRHGDESIRMAAALGLARLGDATGASLLFPLSGSDSGGSSSGRRRTRRSSTPAQSGAPAAWGLTAALTLDAEDVFLSYLDHRDDDIRRQALNLMLSMEWRENGGIPDRCLAALSSADARVRLAGAQALEHFGDLEAFGHHVVEVFNHRGANKKAWTIPEDTILSLSEAVTFGAPRLKARAADVLDFLGESKQGAFNRQWRVFSTRFADELKALEKAAAKRKEAKAAYDQATLMQLVFGAYTGLSRDQGAADWIRRQAVVRVNAMVTEGHAEASAATPVLVQRLSDRAQMVRKAAFQALDALGYDASRLSAEALATGISDVGVMGLELLSAKSGAAEGQKVLLEVLRTRENGLEFEAVKLLAKSTDVVHAWDEGLGARSQQLRRTATNKLTALLGEEKTEAAAVKALLGATSSPFSDVKLSATTALGHHRRPEAYDLLVALLSTSPARDQYNIVSSMLALADPRTPAALLDRIDHDPAGNANLDVLYSNAATFRQEAMFDRYLGDLTDKRKGDQAFSAALAVTGYDQHIGQSLGDLDEGAPEDTSWLEKQHPRRHGLLARLLEAAQSAGQVRWLSNMMQGAQWCPEGVVDAPLAQLAAFPKDGLRNTALEAIAWRLRHRSGPAEALVEALQHKDTATQFYAAEGLALGGRAEGISVLLSSVELLEDLSLRRRAVEALGKLGDARALDLLLRLVNEEGHALQEQAAEAIGHLATGEHRDKIFKILKGLATGEDGITEFALNGLRWFNSDEAWVLIRKRIEDDDWSVRERVCELLAFHDDDASREALVKQVIEDDDWDVAVAAAKSLRAHYGPDSLEPDYAFMQSEHEDLEDETVKRLAEKGDPARLLQLLPKVNEYQEETFVPPLVNALLTRTPMPVEAAAEALGATHDRTVEVAARILGRAGDKKLGEALVQTTSETLATWKQLEARLAATQGNDHGLQSRLEGCTTRLNWLLWACGRLESGADALVEAAGIASRAARTLRVTAVTALSTGFAKKAGLDVLVAAATGPDAELRTLAANAVATLDAKKAATLIEGALDDRPALDRLLATGDGDKVLRAAASQLHSQGVVLPHLVARGDIDSLAAALGDKKLKLEARLGAMEALARIASTAEKAEAAEAPILAVARDEKAEEDLRKAAWRAVRRARRARAPKKTKTQKAKTPSNSGDAEVRS